MKNINKRFVAFVAVFSMFFGIILSSLGDFRVYANETEKLVIGQIINEESKKILEDGMELDYRAEKISKDQMKINIKVNTINEQINTESLFVDCSFLDYFDILEEKIEVTNPELNNDEFKKLILEKKVVENKETVVINLGSVDKSGTAISFTVKLKDLKDTADKTELELKAQLKRNEEGKVTLVEELQKIKVEILTQKEAVIDDTNNTENEIKDETSKEELNNQPPEGEILTEENPSEDVTQEEIPEEDKSNAEDIIESEERQENVEIDFENDQELRDDDKISVEKTINPVIVEKSNAKDTIFEVVLNVTNKNSKKKTFTVKDYIDTNKFEFVSTDGKTGNEVTWKKEIAGKATAEFTYEIRFKDSYEVEEGVYITNPKDKKGEASYDDEKYFENVFVVVVREDSNSGGDNKPEKGELKGEKSVLESEKKDGTYDITFDITGTPGSTGSKPADIVFMIDNSSSMEDEIPIIKESTILAANKLLSLNKDPSNPVVRIALGVFDKESSMKLNFTNDKEKLFNEILKIKTGSGTNTHAGIRKVKDILDNKRTNAESYVLFFSDGFPYNSIGSGDDHKGKAIAEYQQHFSQYSISSGATELKKTKFYSVGMFIGSTINNKAVDFMYQIQNGASDKKVYQDKYFTNNADRVKVIFDEIANEMKGSINDSLATDAVLSDEIAAEFEYVQGQEPSVTTVVNGKDVNLINGTDYTFTVNEKNKIVFNFPKIPVGGVKVTFKIKPSNDYFGTYDEGISGSNGTVKTNGNAILDTKEFDDIKFESPEVSILYKKGTIKVTKNIEGEALSSKDRFIIGFDGPSKCNVEINGAGQTTLDFYLKDDKTDIINNEHYGLSYMLAGEYTVNELVPMNYSDDVKFEVKVNGVAITGKKFTLDKDNNNIEIIVTNKVANRGFLNDRSDKSNIFSYK